MGIGLRRYLFLHRQDIEAVKMIGSLARINADHFVYMNAVVAFEGAHGMFPSSVPFIHIFHFQTDKVGI